MSEPNYRSLFHDAVSALAEIDIALGLPADGCNTPMRTIAEIRRIKEQNARCEALARAAMADQTGKS